MKTHGYPPSDDHKWTTQDETYLGQSEGVVDGEIRTLRGVHLNDSGFWFFQYREKFSPEGEYQGYRGIAKDLLSDSS